MGNAVVPGATPKLEQWIAQYADAILRICFIYLRDGAQAEDAMQDTFIKAWRHMDQLEGQNEKAWLMRIAINTCHDYHRSKWFRHTDMRKALEDLPQPVMAVLPQDHELIASVYELPEKLKQAILLYYYQGLNLEQTAGCLGISRSAVHKRLQKAQLLLKDGWKGEISMTNNLTRAIDTELSGLRTSERERAMILSNVLEGKKVKKKLSVAFVLAMTLILAAAIALAVVTIQETGRTIAMNEQEIGDYIDWPYEKKAAVVRELMDEGYITETAQRKQLRDETLAKEEVARIADEAIAEFTGEEARYASFLSIMNAAWGPFEQWTYEQQAWYSQVMTDVGAETDGKTYYVMPAGPLTEDQAVAIAKKEIARGFGIEESLLDKFRVAEVSFQIPEFAEPGDTKAYWYVMLDTWHTELDGQEGLPFSFIDVFVDPDTGKLLEPIEERVAALKAAKERSNHPINIALRAFEDSTGEEKAFKTWSLQNKARWSAEMVPLLKDYFSTIETDNPLLFGDTMEATTVYTYGLPDDKAIPKERALDISREALRTEYSLSDEELSLLFDLKGPFYEPCLFYDVTDPERPLWKFLFHMSSIYASDDTVAARVKALYGNRDDYDQFYKTEINAYTGEVVRVLRMRYMPDTLEGYMDIY